MALAAKRIVDIAAAAVGLVVLSPILALLAVLIKLDDGGPVLFRPSRVRLHGRPFDVVKFRTMALDAEARKAGLRAGNEIQGHAFKLTKDPRVTRFGRALRRLSLDVL